MKGVFLLLFLIWWLHILRCWWELLVCKRRKSWATSLSFIDKVNQVKSQTNLKRIVNTKPHPRLTLNLRLQRKWHGWQRPLWMSLEDKIRLALTGQCRRKSVVMKTRYSIWKLIVYIQDIKGALEKILQDLCYWFIVLLLLQFTKANFKCRRFWISYHELFSEKNTSKQ